MKAKIVDIEILRAIAVSMVVFQHLGNLFPAPLPLLEGLYEWIGGTFGVDLFLAVSGFVISRDLVPHLRQAPDRASAWLLMRAFWVRRIWRLWPSAWLWLFIILVAVVFFNSSGAFGSLKANLDATLAGLLHYANFRFATHFMVKEMGASFVYWSLSLEEQFYLLFPFLIVVFRRHLVWVLLVIALTQLILPRETLLQMMLRTDALILDVLIALWSRTPSWTKLKKMVSGLGKGICILLMTVSVGSMLILSSRLELTSYAISLIAIFSGLLVLIASFDSDLFSPKGWVRAVCLWLGSRSYGIYLIHAPVFFAVREGFYRWGGDTLMDSWQVAGYLACMLILLSVLVELNYRLIEMRLRRFGNDLSARMLGQLSSDGPANGQLLTPTQTKAEPL